MSQEINQLRDKVEYFENKREEILAALNSLKGQKEVLDSQKSDLLEELKKFDCKNSKELEDKIASLKTEIDNFKIDIPDEILCNLR